MPFRQSRDFSAISQPCLEISALSPEAFVLLFLKHGLPGGLFCLADMQSGTVETNVSPKVAFALDFL